LWLPTTRGEGVRRNDEKGKKKEKRGEGKWQLINRLRIGNGKRGKKGAVNSRGGALCDADQYLTEKRKRKEGRDFYFNAILKKKEKMFFLYPFRAGK